MKVDDAALKVAVFGVLLGGTVLATAAVATWARGPAWGLGAAAGGAAIALNFLFLVTYARAWLAAATRKKRPVLWGVVALAAKTVFPPAVILALAWTARVPAGALALGVLVVVTAAPVCVLAAVRPRRAAAALTSVWKS